MSHVTRQSNTISLKNTHLADTAGCRSADSVHSNAVHPQRVNGWLSFLSLTEAELQVRFGCKYTAHHDHGIQLTLGIAGCRKQPLSMGELHFTPSCACSHCGEQL
jgi:hypothetical protein